MRLSDVLAGLVAFAMQDTIALPAVPEFVPTTTAAVALKTWDEHDRDSANLVPPKIIEVGKSALAGVRHTYEANDPQLSKLAALWERIQPTVVLVEGRPGFYLGKRTDVVRRLGETGWALMKAVDMRIRTLSWEPSRKAETDTLLRTGSEKDAAAYLFLRVYFGDRRTSPVPDAQAETLLKRRLGQYGLAATFPSLAEFDDYWRRRPGLPSDWRAMPESAIGARAPAPFGSMASDLLDLRTSNLVRALFELTGKGERVLALCGSSHALRAEPALIGKTQMFCHKPAAMGKAF